MFIIYVLHTWLCYIIQILYFAIEPHTQRYNTIYNSLNTTGGKASFVLHVVFSILNTMYIPYAIIYYVQRVYLMCKVNSACITLSLADYITEETIVILVGILLHIPIFYVLLMVLDVKKSGGKAREIFKSLGVSFSPVIEEVV